MVCEPIPCSEFRRRLLRRRPIAKEVKLETPLKRCLNAPQLTLYCIAHMIGAGLYVLTGQLIRDYAGPATAVAYLVAAVSSIFTAMCYAEFMTLFPRAGSAYLYTYLMFGELPAFLIGWTMVSDIIVSTAAISKAFSGTINLLSNNTIREWSLKNLVNLGSTDVADPTPDIVAAAFLICLLILTLTGANVSMTINAILSALQLSSLMVITIGCFVWGNSSNYSNEGGFLPFGFAGLLKGAGLAIFGFSGFEAIANASEEAKNPRRDLPIALFVSLLICAVLYVGASLGLAYIAPRTTLMYDSPFVGAFTYVNQPEMMGFAAFATLLATGATKLVAMYVIPRFFYAMASDGLLFSFMAIVERRTQVPIWSLFIGAFITIVLATFIKIQILAEFTSVGIIFSYFFIGLDLMALRYTFAEGHLVLEKDRIKYSGTGLAIDVEHSYKDSAPLLDSSTLCLRDFTPTCFKGLESRTCFILLLWAYVLAVLAVGVMINVNVKAHLYWLWIVCGASSGIVILLFWLLCFYKPTEIRKGFETPLMPVAPCVTILTNGILITSMEPLTWARFIIWSVLGLIIYFLYGMWYSTADVDRNKYMNPDSEKSEDLKTPSLTLETTG